MLDGVMERKETELTFIMSLFVPTQNRCAKIRELLTAPITNNVEAACRHLTTYPRSQCLLNLIARLLSKPGSSFIDSHGRHVLHG